MGAVGAVRGQVEVILADVMLDIAKFTNTPSFELLLYLDCRNNNTNPFTYMLASSVPRISARFGELLMLFTSAFPSPWQPLSLSLVITSRAGRPIDARVTSGVNGSL
jgi:hypothetical protein